MDEWLSIAKTTGYTAPFLWIGPTAPGHQKKPTGNDDLPAVWQYAIDTAQAAQSRDMDVLGMYNATLQAESFDGTRYGEKVALMQAMMVFSGIQIKFIDALLTLPRLSIGWLLSNLARGLLEIWLSALVCSWVMVSI